MNAITHTIQLNNLKFRQALASALLFVDSKASAHDALGNVCIHHKTGSDSVTVSGLDGHGFFHQTLEALPIFQGEGQGAAVSSLPCGEGSFSDCGQLLIPAASAAAIVKLMSKKGHGFITLEVTPSESAQYRQEVRFISSDGVTFTFTAHVTGFPDYTQFMGRAQEAKDALTLPQGRTFPNTEFSRIAKALPEKFFDMYLGASPEAPCLIEQAEISLIFMPAKMKAKAA